MPEDNNTASDKEDGQASTDVRTSKVADVAKAKKAKKTRKTRKTRKTHLIPLLMGSKVITIGRP